MNVTLASTMSCTNFKAPLIQRMYSLVVQLKGNQKLHTEVYLISWQYISKEGKTKILQTLDVIYQEQHFHGKIRVIPMDSFTQRFHVSTSHRSHFYTRSVLCIQNTFFSQWSNYIFTGHWKCSQVRSVQKRLSATYKRKKAKATMNIHKKANQNECISAIKGAFEVCSADTLG